MYNVCSMNAAGRGGIFTSTPGSKGERRHLLFMMSASLRSEITLQEHSIYIEVGGLFQNSLVGQNTYMLFLKKKKTLPPCLPFTPPISKEGGFYSLLNLEISALHYLKVRFKKQNKKQPAS